MALKNNIRTIERCNDSPIIQIQVNEPIRERIFYWRGFPYIVGQKQRFNGHLWEMELRPVECEMKMHIHQYFNGVCYICGIFRLDESS